MKTAKPREPRSPTTKACAGPAGLPAMARCGELMDWYSDSTCSRLAGRPRHRSSMENTFGATPALPRGEGELLGQIFRLRRGALEADERVVDHHVAATHGALADDDLEHMLGRFAPARAHRHFVGHHQHGVL